MVKGITRRVVLIKSPDPKLFDEAIFIVREDVGRSGVTCEQILRQAMDTAEEYVRSKMSPPRRHPLPFWFWTLAGALPTGLIWLLTAIL